MSAIAIKQQSQKRKHRWSQFGLRGMLICISLIAVLLAIECQRAQRQRRAVAIIEQMGGEVVYRYETRWDPEYGPQKPGPKWLRQLIGDHHFVTAVGVSLDSNKASITNRVLEALGRLDSLESVNLRGTGVTDRALIHLYRLPRLRDLDLVGTSIIDRGLRSLKHCRSLESLNLRSTQITDAGLEHLKSLGELKSVVVAGTRITERGRRDLQTSRFPNLTVYR